MAAMTIIEKVRSNFNELLPKRGWQIVNNEWSGIWHRNGVYFVLFGTGDFAPIAEVEGDLKVGYVNLLKSKKLKWALTKDGFYLDGGGMKRSWSDAYGVNESHPVAKPIVDFANEITSLTEKSELELDEMKCKEIQMASGLNSSESIEYDPRGVVETRMFMVNPEAFKGVLDYFENGVVYTLDGFSAGVFTISDYSTGNEVIKLPPATLQEMSDAGGLVAVSIVTKKVESEDYYYDKIGLDSSIEIGREYDDLNLNASQKEILKSAMKKGVNFTPLLYNGLSVEGAKSIQKVLENGVCCKCLVGKDFDDGILAFLANVSNNRFPIDGLCLEGASLDFIQDKYSRFLEGVSNTLRMYGSGFSQQKTKVIQEIAFKFNGIEHLLDCPYDEPMRLRLYDLKKYGGKFSEIAKVILEKGSMDGNSNIRVLWDRLSVDERRMVLGMFKVGGLTVGGVSLDDYLIDNQSRISYLNYHEKQGFILQVADKFINLDYNSVAIDWNGKIIWRSVRVNEKDYVYENLSGASLN